MSLLRRVARPMLASVFVVQGIQTLRKPEEAVEKSRPVIDRIRPLLQRYVPQLPTDPRSLIRLNAAVHVVAGAALAAGRLPRTSSLVLVASLVPTAAAAHRFWEPEDPADRTRLRSALLKDVALAGGLLIAAVDTEGRPGVAWRTQHVARSAKRLARTARRESRLAAKAATADARRQVSELVH